MIWFRVLGFRVLGFRVQGLGCFRGTWIGVLGSGLILNLESETLNLGLLVPV